MTTEEQLLLRILEMRPRMDPRLLIQAVRRRHDETNHHRRVPALEAAAAAAATMTKMHGNRKVLDLLDGEEVPEGAVDDQVDKTGQRSTRRRRAAPRARRRTVVAQTRLRRVIVVPHHRPIMAIRKMSMYHPIGARQRWMTTSAGYVISR